MGLYYKTLQIRILQQMARFRSKLVSFLLSVTNTLAWINTILDKHTRLLQNTMGLYYKTLQIRILQQMARFRSKLVSFLLSVTNTLAWTNTILDKHTRLLQNTMGLYYKTLQIRILQQMTRFRSKLVSFLLSVTNTLALTITVLDKHTRLLRNPRGLYDKTLCIRILQQLARFHGKLVSFVLSVTNTLA
jgi:heme/copper-type cytochrome/quinol oxidase subunit 4